MARFNAPDHTLTRQNVGDLLLASLAGYLAANSDNKALTGLLVTLNDDPLTLDEQGQATVLAETPGRYELQAIVRDSAGNLSQEAVLLRVT